MVLGVGVVVGVGGCGVSGQKADTIKTQENDFLNTSIKKYKTRPSFNAAWTALQWRDKVGGFCVRACVWVCVRVGVCECVHLLRPHVSVCVFLIETHRRVWSNQSRSHSLFYCNCDA